MHNNGRTAVESLKIKPLSRAVQLAVGCTLLLPAVAALAQSDIELADVGINDNGFTVGTDQGLFAAGTSVSGAGDVNGDGLADVIIGAPSANGNDGQSYVIFGTSTSDNVDFTNLNGRGFTVSGPRGNSGYSVSGAGDVNGDGFDDVIIGAPRDYTGYRFQEGISYVVFGDANPTDVNLGSLGARGFRVIGGYDYVGAGTAVSGAGDINGDGLDDLIVASGSFGYAPAIIFGKTTTTDANMINPGSGGFTITGLPSGGARAVSGAGDVNGDGLADVVIAARYADPLQRTDAGETYVVFGKTDASNINVSGTFAGFTIAGEITNDRSGTSVAGAGDVNGDGFSDLVVGAEAAPGGSSGPGIAYVVFGKSDSAPIDLANNPAGFRIEGIDFADQAGHSVSSAGDVNGDGLADLLVGAPNASFNQRSNQGEVYVVFGKNDNGDVDLSIPDERSFVLRGVATGDRAGSSVSGAGDVNGDGISDIIIGAPNANNPSQTPAGESYIVFSPLRPRQSATYRAIAAVGNAPQLAIGVPGDGSQASSPDSRFWIDFANGSGPSLQTVTLNRFAPRSPTGSLAASSHWRVVTDRTNWNAAGVTMHYTDLDIRGIDESELAVYRASNSAGPWTRIDSSVDTDRNEATALISRDGFLALGAPALEKQLATRLPDHPTASPGDRAGASVSLSQGGTMLLSGIPGDSGVKGSRGRVALFDVENGRKQLVGTIPNPGDAAPGFGSKVMYTGSLLAIGTEPATPGAKGPGGSDPLTLALYNQLQLGFEQIASIKASQALGGGAIAVEGNFLMLGNPTDGAGSVSVFEFTGSGLNFTNKIPAPPSAGGGFGSSIASNNGMIAVGAPGLIGQAVAGSAHLYSLIAGNLMPMGPPVFGSTSASGDQFGQAITLSGTTMYVGSPLTANVGAVDSYLYDGGGNTIFDTQYVPPDPFANSQFGTALALNGDQLIVGSPGANSIFSGTGGIYFYDGLGFQSKLQAPNGLFQFGSSVSSADGILAVGAPGTASNTGAAVVIGPPPIFADGFEED